MPTPSNTFKRRLHQRVPQRGLFSTLTSTALLELLAGWGFDWILIDTEHSPNEMSDVIAQLQVLSAHEVSPIVRPAWSDMVLIKRLLDAGAQNLLIPNIETAEQAAAAVSYTRYPPTGVRGVSGSSRAARYGQTTDYLQTAEREICVLVQLETGQGLDNLEEIAAVQGVDGIFIGPADLAASLGHLGNPQHPAVQSRVNDAFRRLRALHKPSGYLTLNEQEARTRIAEGVDVIGVATDTSIINRGAAATLAGLLPGAKEAS